MFLAENEAPSVVPKSNAIEIVLVDEFFHHDPTLPYSKPLPDHSLEHSPFYHIIAEKQGYYYCKLHPQIKNIHLKSI